MRKILLSFSVALFSQFLTAQTIYIQGRDWVGRNYVVSYPINQTGYSFTRGYDAAGVNAYYKPSPESYSNQYDKTYLKEYNYTDKKTTPRSPDPVNFIFEPPAWFYDNPFEKK